jgi:hypothetical protein
LIAILPLNLGESETRKYGLSKGNRHSARFS